LRTSYDPQTEVRMNTRLIALVTAVLSVTAGSAHAQGGPPALGAVLAAVNNIQASVSQISGALNAMQVTILTNETVCTGSSVQCSGSGHTSDAAATANHNPVAVMLFVTRNGQPVSGLPSSAFSYEQKFAPASAPGFGPCGDAISGNPPPGDQVGCGSSPESLFQDGADGVYAFYVHPTAPGFTWTAGMYTFVVRVTDGLGTGVGFGKLVIP
jgi:hypothetical protein